MTIVPQGVPELVAGDFLSRDEFLHRWEAMPLLKRAELLRGVVYMPPRVGCQHGSMNVHVIGWHGVYHAYTPGTEGLSNATWLMGQTDVPQPDSALLILPECGGQSWVDGLYAAGAPESVAEVCVSSTSYDLHQKLEVYEEAGVQEYLAVLLREQEVRWHRLTEGHFEIVPLPADGIYRSTVFPGLWLDAAALLAGDLACVLAVLQQGIGTAEHRAFVEELLRRQQGQP